VEWTLNYPGADFSSATVQAGPVASAANKSVTCDMTLGSATCILWGGNNTAMTNGVAATIALVISSSTLDTSSQIQVSSPIAASSDAFPFASTATGGTVTILQPAALDGFSCTPVSLSPPAVATCTLQLTTGAPVAGASIGLSTSLPDVNMPAALSIPATLTSGSFTVTPLTVSSPASITLTASYLGVTEGFGLTINPPPTVLSALTISPNVLLSGQSASGTVTISEPAGPGGVVVALSSSNLAAPVPPSVTISAGLTTASFTTVAAAVSSTTPVVLTASYAGAIRTANLTIHPPIALTGLTLSPSSVFGGKSTTGTVTLSEPAGVGGILVTLAGSNAAATVPVSVTVPQGSTTATFAVTSHTVTKLTTVTIAASYALNEETAALKVYR
jgi:hypothetical protein